MSFISSYKSNRDALVKSFYDPAFTDEITSRIGWSANDDKANQRLEELRNEIVRQPDYYAKKHYESRFFVDVRDEIEATDLFTFIRALPKGGILHIHPSAMGDYAGLIELASTYSTGGKQYYVNYNNATQSPSDFFQLKEAPGTGDLLLSDEWGNEDGRDKIMSFVTMTSKDMDYDGDVWDLFQPVFSRIGPLMWEEPLARPYYRNAFLYLAQVDNLDHVELRTSWHVENEDNASTKEGIILAALRDVQEVCPDFSLKVIYSDSRGFKSSSSEKIIGDVKAVADALKSGNNYLVGYDLVGEEDTGETTDYSVADFATAFDDLGNYLPPFYFHDGESDLPPDYEAALADGSPAETYCNNNMVDAYLLNTLEGDGFKQAPARVGHGLELFKTPKLLHDYRNAGIAIELCPISNQLLHYVLDLREHPGQSYLAAGMPVSLSPDDPAIYSYQGVSHDFWEACIAWNLDLKAIKLLCYYSLQYSSLSAEEKARKICTWKASWDKAIAAIASR